MRGIGTRSGWVGVAAACMAGAAVVSGSLAEEDDAAEIAAARHDAIVGTWVGTGTHAAGEGEFNMRLTFVSPKGGVSRYPDIPCGGVLVGGRKGDGYEYQETISYNGPEERSENYCIGGFMNLKVTGSTMTYDWSSNYNGEDFFSTGKLKRVR